MWFSTVGEVSFFGRLFRLKFMESGGIEVVGISIAKVVYEN